ncbi:MAG: cupin domain-containing protein [Deltaproteobacteria bacterium]|nr:cupin domain-containing protein [Deltaproteobacteria bacterium]
MTRAIDGGAVFTALDVEASEYLPNRGVWLRGLLGKVRGNTFGLYHGRIEPGCAIAREVHPETAETVYVLKGEAVALVGEGEVPLGPGQGVHVKMGVPHGLRNVGAGDLEFLVLGHPDF